MSSQQNEEKANGQSEPQPSSQRKFHWAWVILLVAGLGVATALRWPRGQPAETPAPDAAPPTETRATNGTATATEVRPDFQKLKGRWVRPDGGYVLEIRNLAGAGPIDAAYFNPNPIKVSRAEVSREGPVMKVFVELRDVNYPGCTYNLKYVPQIDQLVGVYFQAAMQESFDVAFERMP